MLRVRQVKGIIPRAIASHDAAFGCKPFRFTGKRIAILGCLGNRHDNCDRAFVFCVADPACFLP